MSSIKGPLPPELAHNRTETTSRLTRAAGALDRLAKLKEQRAEQAARGDLQQKDGWVTRATRASSNLRPRRTRSTSGEGDEPSSPRSPLFGGKRSGSPRAAKANAKPKAKAEGGKKNWWGRAVSKKKGRPEKKATFELSNGTIEDSPTKRASDNADSNSNSERDPSHEPAAERNRKDMMSQSDTNGSPARSSASSMDRTHRSERSTKSAAPKIGIAF